MEEDPFEAESARAQAESRQEQAERAQAGPATGRSLLSRALLMVLMAIAYQISEIVLFVIAVAQLIFAVATGKPNPHLRDFGRSLAQYYRQVVDFLTFASEDLPFPFRPWP